MKFTIALAQIDCVIGNPGTNVRKHAGMVRRARDGGADLVVFPELSLTGYNIRDINWDVALRASDTKLLDPLLTESNEISIILGGVEESSDYGIYNSAFLLEKGTVRTVHRKVYPPTYGMFEELRYFSPGRNARAFDTEIGRLGVLICEDLWHLPLPYILAQDRAEMIIGIAASPTRLAGDDARIQNAQINSEQHKALARLLSTYVVFCNRVGYEDGVNFWGGSEIIGPSGEVVAQAKLFEEDLIFADIDENEVRRARRLSRHFLDDDPRLTIEALTRILNQRA
jgi:NAD+ synthase (glutamine-hydrolysing)